MAASLFEHGAIRTTEPKGKDLRRFVEKLITIAKKNSLHARRRVIAELQDRPEMDKQAQPEPTGRTIVQKLFNEIAPRYADRPGGYTRIIRLPDRRIGDAGRQVLLQLVEETTTQTEHEPQGRSRRRQRAARRIEAVEKVEPKDQSTASQPDQDVAEEITDQPAENQQDQDGPKPDEKSPTG